MKNQLCRIALSGLLATGLTLGTAAAFAQQDSPAAPDASAQQPGSGHMGGRQQMTPDEQLARMTKRRVVVSRRSGPRPDRVIRGSTRSSR